MWVLSVLSSELNCIAVCNTLVLTLSSIMFDCKYINHWVKLEWQSYYKASVHVRDASSHHCKCQIYIESRFLYKLICARFCRCLSRPWPSALMVASKSPEGYFHCSDCGSSKTGGRWRVKRVCSGSPNGFVSLHVSCSFLPAHSTLLTTTGTSRGKLNLCYCYASNYQFCSSSLY